MIYDDLAKALLDWHCENLKNKFGLNDGEYIFTRIEPWGDFGFTSKMNYTGLMAQPSRTGRNKGIVKRSKQGLFDIFINTGTFFDNSGLTHRNILECVTEYSTLDNCIDVWRGVDPEKVSRTTEEYAILTSIMLAFFEQEINWGNEEWQRYTYFAPKVTMPNKKSLDETALREKVDYYLPKVTRESFKFELVPGITLFFTEWLAEKPINIVIKKNLLDTIAIFHKRIY